MNILQLYAVILPATATPTSPGGSGTTDNINLKSVLVGAAVAAAFALLVQVFAFLLTARDRKQGRVWEARREVYLDARRATSALLDTDAALTWKWAVEVRKTPQWDAFVQAMETLDLIGSPNARYAGAVFRKNIGEAIDGIVDPSTAGRTYLGLSQTTDFPGVPIGVERGLNDPRDVARRKITESMRKRIAAEAKKREQNFVDALGRDLVGQRYYDMSDAIGEALGYRGWSWRLNTRWWRVRARLRRSRSFIAVIVIACVLLAWAITWFLR